MKKAKKIFLYFLIPVTIFGLAYRYGTPKIRFLRDGRNPKTQWGSQVGSYVAGGSFGTVDDNSGWHIKNDSEQFKRYKLKGWAFKQ